jgi:uncharacterized tellurite resistance protein B-like protein
MSFWDLLTGSASQDNSKKVSGLHNKIHEIFPDKSEEEIIKMTCLAGLLARVAYVDFELHDNEQSLMESALIERCGLETQTANKVSQIATEEVKELAGLENHLYSDPLNDIMNNGQRYSIIECLFHLAASDGEVSNDESEEIRLINKALLLEHKHFIAARAKVVESLGSLKD